MSNRKKRSDVTVRTRTSAARSPNERLEPARAPSRPRGLQEHEPSRFLAGLVRVTSGLLTFALVLMILIGGSAAVVYSQFERPGPLTEARTVVVPKGKGRIQIAEALEEQGVIANRWTFVAGHVFQALSGGKRNPDLKAGEYEIKPNASMREVLDTLIEGKSIQYKVAIPEGLTSQQIVERLRAEPNLTGEIISVPAEGTLMPDTYLISKGMERQELISRMQTQMTEFVAQAWEKRQTDLPLRTIEDAVTFASIVEKETGRADERARVAAVFHNRLKKGMRLQSDPTIIYGIVGGQGSLGRPITKPDIDTKTAYNTYQINGLPPGPICNPGRDAIEAALRPATTSDLYFVADGTGGHTFSENLKDHNAAVQKWREVERQAKSARGDSDGADDAADAAPIPASQDAAEAPAGKAPAKRAAANDDVPLPVRKPKKQ